MPNGESTILSIQESLFKRTDPKINLSISADNTLITASNITEESFADIALVTNNPGFQNSYMSLVDIDVYLNNEILPTEIYGLLPIVQQRIQNSDAKAYTLNRQTHKPFENGFQNNITIGELIDTLSSLSSNTPDTFGIVKKFVLKFDPPPEYNPQNRTDADMKKNCRQS
jgi:hypothetical protein